jgi:hypothetical protein
MFPVRPHVTRPRLSLGVAAIATGACALVLGSSASAQSPTTLTFKELNKGSTFGYIDDTPISKAKGEPSASLGDQIVFTNPVADTAGKRTGRLYAHCTVVVAAQRASNASFACDAMMIVPGGMLSVQAFLPHDGATVHGTVTGGTGVYANARGTLVSRPTKTGDIDTFTLVF